MSTELPAQGGDAASKDGAREGFVDQLVGEVSDLDDELGEDVELDDEAAA
jgi:hypothetical protein